MGNDYALYRFRLGVFALAKELGNVRAACRMMGIHHSTFYRWKKHLERHGTEILRPRERRRPRMPNATSPFAGAPDSGVRSWSPRVWSGKGLR